MGWGGSFARRSQMAAILASISLIITGITFGSIGYQRQLEVTATTALAGSDGFNGTKGDKGDPGIDGRNGTDGAPGIDGRNGTDGAPGATGLPGADGRNGTNGAPGPTGSAGATGATGTPGANATLYYQMYTHETTTFGPALYAYTWTTRSINTVRGGNMHGVFTSLASNTITVQPGTYRFIVTASQFGNDRNMIKLQNTSNNVIICPGLAAAPHAMTSVTCIFTTASAIGVQVQQWSQTSNDAGQGLDVYGSPGTPWAFMMVEIIKFA